MTEATIAAHRDAFRRGESDGCSGRPSHRAAIADPALSRLYGKGYVIGRAMFITTHQYRQEGDSECLSHG